MLKRVDAVDPDLLTLAKSVEALEHRVIVLEQMLVSVSVAAPSPVSLTSTPDPTHESLHESLPRAAPQTDSSIVARLSLVGRTLIVLGGAYLLRALTEGGVLPLVAGVSAGLVYALVWLAFSTKAAARGANVSASFHGFTAALIAFPLIWEATSRFALLGAPAGAVLLGAFAAAVLMVAFRCGLESIAWFGALGATGTALALAIATRSFAPYTILLVLVGVSTVWFGYVREWVLLRWPIAFAVDLMTIAIAARAIDPDVAAATWPTVALLLFPVAAYLASFVSRTLFLGRDLIPFEVVQSSVVIIAGVGGALATLRAGGVSAVPLGVVVVTLGAACYLFAYRVIEPRQHWRNLAFYTSLAVALTIAGVCLVVPGRIALPTLAVLAIVSLELARRSSRLTLAFHGFVFAAATAVVSGLALLAWQALAGSVRSPWLAVDSGILVALAVIAVSVAWASPEVPARWTNHARAFGLIRLSVLVCTGCAVAVALLAPVLAGVPGAGADAGKIATVRTVVLVGALFTILASRRRDVPVECTWLAYGLLAAVGLKFIIEDLPNSRPATLFVALAVYGIALVIAPRLARGANVERQIVERSETI